MKYRRLGRTQLKVSELGFGAWGIGKSMWKGSQDEESLRALHTAIDLGVNFIDTALVYGKGHSEKLIGQVLRESNERIHVATKIPPKNYKWPASGSLAEVFPRNHIVGSAERSLENLKIERIDLLQLHVWNSDWFCEDEWYATLCQLRDSGKISYFGVSINDHEPDTALELVGSGKVDTVQVIFNIFDQSPKDHLFSACAESNVGIIVRVPFDEGSLTGKITPSTSFPKGDWRNLYFAGDRKRRVYERVARLEALLGDEAETLPDLALKYCLHPNVVSTVIPGMRTVEHVVTNAAVSNTPDLSNETLEKLREHRWDRNFYPAS
jgi:aryl-alcohol dehydrogenase-like predicted oxidoreductase